MKSKKNILPLFLTFMKIGTFTFGGGYAMIPLIQREAAENKKWIKEEEMLDVVSIAESTPGPIAINAATYVGYRAGGFIGSVAATLGVVIPSLLIIMGVSFILDAFKDSKLVSDAFKGIRAGVLALIIKALCSMYRQSKRDLFYYIIAAAAFIATAFAGVGAIPVIASAAVVGVIYSFFVTRRVKK